MSRRSRLKFDKIGYWSEVKLDIIKDYASAYSTIFGAERQRGLHHIYIDAFAGLGVHISRATGRFVAGSPLNALYLQPAFRAYHFIDLDRAKVAALKQIIGQRTDVYVHDGDCNSILLRDVFPTVQFKDFRRGLCLLDPYGLHLKWDVIQTAGQMKTIDMFLNFPVADINRNMLWRHPEQVDPADIKRMNAFWGDDSWRDVAYTTKKDLFGHLEKEDNETVAEAFRNRLQKVAGFKYVPILFRCATPEVLLSTTYFSPPRNQQVSGSLRLSFGSIAEGESSYGLQLLHRVDGFHLEPGDRMHEDQPGVQTLLRRTNGNPAGRNESAALPQWFRSHIAP